MKRTLLAVIAAALCLAATGTYAHQLTIENLTSQDIVNASAKTGKVEGFRRVGSGSYRTFNVTLPAGECDARLVVRFADGQTVDTVATLCGGFKLTITQVSR